MDASISAVLVRFPAADGEGESGMMKQIHERMESVLDASWNCHFFVSHTPEPLLQRNARFDSGGFLRGSTPIIRNVN